MNATTFPRQTSTDRLPHCTPTWGGHSLVCDRDGRYCSMASSHDGPCKPHGQPVETSKENRSMTTQIADQYAEVILTSLTTGREQTYKDSGLTSFHPSSAEWMATVLRRRYGKRFTVTVRPTDRVPEDIA